jgi:hypothetical protein
MLLRKEMAAIFLLLRSNFCRRDSDLLAFILLLLKIPTLSTLQSDVTDDNAYKQDGMYGYFSFYRTKHMEEKSQAEIFDYYQDIANSLSTKRYTNRYIL